MAGTTRARTRRTAAEPRPRLRDLLHAPDAFVAIAELVPWRGTLDDEKGTRALEAARDLAGDPRIAALSITDNAGGHARLGPATIAEEFVARGQEVIVHVACRDRSRTALQSLGWELASRGLTNVLALSGDYPVEGFAGLSKPVFDIDSVALLRMYADTSAELAPTGFEGFYLGAAVNNHKRHEREVIPQYLKLAMKVRNGAGFIISQVGYDARKQDELLRYMRAAELDVPAIANAYVLGRGVARAFHDGRVPGCVVTDELMAIVERQAASPDKGRAFFLEFAAKQVAIARGLGYRGIYLSGHRDAGEVGRILETAAGFGPDDWRTFAHEIRFASPGEFHYFEEDPDTGLSSDRVNRRYLRSRTPAALARARRRGSIAYRMNRIAHARIFQPGTPGFREAGRFYAAAERYRLAGPLHVLEHAGKMPLFDCRDCGDCSLPDIAYLCPESQCAKNQRNGPCGGTHDGLCEVGEKPCIWAKAYDRLKPYGEEASMLDRPPVIQDNALRGTSAWANTFLRRDHFARPGAEPAIDGVSNEGHGEGHA
jgi:methylenetetrahydrofolate reductase (NADPH)